MIITCPNCSTRYRLPESEGSAEPGKVCCTKCRYEWRKASPAPKCAALPLSHLISCPECSVHYQVNQYDLPLEGRDVRCKNCRHAWHYVPNSRAVPEASGEAMEVPVATQAVRKRDLSKPLTSNFDYKRDFLDTLISLPSGARHFGNSRSRMFSGARFACIGMLTAGLLAIWWVMPTKRTHSLSGQTVNKAVGTSPVAAAPNTSMIPSTSAGIRLRDVTYNRSLAYGLGTTITIRGTIENSAGEELRLPKSVLIVLSDANKKILYETKLAPNVKKLGPHESVSFEAEIYKVPPGTEKLELTLDKSHD